ncbi:MAG: diaminopimelate epimerase [Bacteroidales bacterium]
MIIRFYKYHGSGNDFILIDNRSLVVRNYNKSADIIARLCHRKFGIGGDGLILVNRSNDMNFEMVYFNSDGKEGSMCGNGGFCCVAYANSLGIIKDKTVFKATDGLHEAIIMNKEKDTTFVSLKMQDVQEIKKHDEYFLINTGSPHYIRFTQNVKKLDIFSEGRKIRYSEAFLEKGVNVNFAELHEEYIFLRTYERGVEDETLSCGTGATAAALAASFSGYIKNKTQCHIKMPGGNLTVRFNKTSETSFDNIWIDGTAVCVYKGEINI